MHQMRYFGMAVVDLLLHGPDAYAGADGSKFDAVDYLVKEKGFKRAFAGSEGGKGVKRTWSDMEEGSKAEPAHCASLFRSVTQLISGRWLPQDANPVATWYH